MMSNPNDQFTKTMDEFTRRAQVGIDMYIAKDYTDADLKAHFLQLANDQGAEAIKHKERLEILMNDMENLLNKQALFFSGHKSLKSDCMKDERSILAKLQYMKTHMGYSTDHLKKPVVNNIPKENKLFK